MVLENNHKNQKTSRQYILIEITLWHGCSPVILLPIFRTLFSRNTSGWLLLHVSDTVYWHLDTIWFYCKNDCPDVFSNRNFEISSTKGNTFNKCRRIKWHYYIETSDPADCLMFHSSLNSAKEKETNYTYWNIPLERDSITVVFRWNLRHFSYTFFTEHLRTTTSVYKIPRSCIMVCSGILNPQHFITKFMVLFPHKYRILMWHFPILYFFLVVV